MNKKNEEESKRQFTISLVASIIGVFSSILVIVIGRSGDSQFAKLLLVMGYVLLGSMLIMLFETIRLWKKNRVNE